MTSKSMKYIEIADKNNKIKVEINDFFEKALKELKKKSPETFKTLKEQIDAIIKETEEKKKELQPKNGEVFKDTFGRSYMVTSKNTLSEDQTVTLRRGNVQYKVKMSDCYEKNGKKKIIAEDKLTEESIEIKF
jgi:actin-like ATPase involved in cell morphogenesis